MGVFAFKLSNAASKSTRAKLLKLAEKTSNLRALAVNPPADWSVNCRVLDPGTSVNDDVGLDQADSRQADAEGRALAVMQGGSDAYIGTPAEGRND
jgi:GTP diphosphokinase / guanosine-3',5'-bis(diphosphate) 3'-diphosphatase